MIKKQFYKTLLPLLTSLFLGWFLYLSFAQATPLRPTQLQPQDYDWIAKRIYQNEIGGNPENLTFWHKNEEFPSLGIGHFIWIPKDSEVPFVETFPQMVQYVSHVEAAPKWLRNLRPFQPPWQNKAQFDHDFYSQRMKQLRRWLSITHRAQAEFIYLGLTEKWQAAMPNLSDKKRQKVNALFSQMQTNRMGLFALIDYYNFKGLGANAQEQYKGKGWGLIDVLAAMPEQTPNHQLLQVFVETAKKTLKQRTHNAPKKRNEQQFLKGWHHRLDQYLNH